MIKVSSAIKLNMPKIKQLTQAQVTALEQTAEAPYRSGAGTSISRIPKPAKESTFVDYSNSSKGKVSIIQHRLCTTPVFSSRVSFPERRKSKC